jgi:hypothetical protein
MAYSDGDDFVSGAKLTYQQANRLKNNFRGSSAPTNPSPGMLFSGSANNKLWHAIDDSILDWDEILQASMSFDVTPIFDNLILDLDSADLSDPPTEAELISVFGSSPVDGFLGFIQSSDSAGKVYIIFTAGGSFFYLEMTLAA